MISFVSRLAALSPALETKSVLSRVIDRLHAASKVQHVLRPPVPGETVEFTAGVEKLSVAFASAVLKQRGIHLDLTVSGSAMIDAMRAWRANLIISELITNSVRHAHFEKASWIRIVVATNGADVFCQVSDNGTSAAAAEPGVGSHLIDALAEELDGRITRSFTGLGAVVTLCFPTEP